MKHMLFAAILLAPPAFASGADHAACIQTVNEAYEASQTIMAGRMAANDMVVRNLRGEPDQGLLIDTGSAADDAISAYIDALSAACEKMR